MIYVQNAIKNYLNKMDNIDVLYVENMIGLYQLMRINIKNILMIMIIMMNMMSDYIVDTFYNIKVLFIIYHYFLLPLKK